MSAKIASIRVRRLCDGFPKVRARNMLPQTPKSHYQASIARNRNRILIYRFSHERATLLIICGFQRFGRHKPEDYTLEFFDMLRLCLCWVLIMNLNGMRILLCLNKSTIARAASSQGHTLGSHSGSCITVLGPAVLLLACA